MRQLNPADPFTADDARLFIAGEVGRRQGNKVLHAHPSPLFWRERDVPVGEILAARRAERGVDRTVALYVATPYCLPTRPRRCGYCLFPSEEYAGRHQLTEYLGYLHREAEMLRPSFAGDELGSAYFGGGTANLYPPQAYASLLDVARVCFPAIAAGTELTLEGIPQLFTRDKLLAIRDAGFTRVSIGVQQIDDDLIALSGRKQTARHVWQALAWCDELQLVTSVDLIFGWPDQTVDRMLRDLERVVAAGVRHITHYELNVAGRSAFATALRDRLPTIEQNLEMYRAAKAYLGAHGYEQATAYDWERRVPADGDAGPRRAAPGRYRYEESLRDFFTFRERRLQTQDLVGIGTAAISILAGTPRRPAASYVNHTSVAPYRRAIDSGKLPVERGFLHARSDQRLVWIFQQLQGLAISRARYARVFGMDVVEEHRAVFDAIEERGWAEIGPDAVRVVGDGGFFLPIIQSALAARRVEQLRQDAGDTPAAERAVRRAPAPSASPPRPAGSPVSIVPVRVRAGDGLALQMYRLHVHGPAPRRTPVILAHGTFSNARTCARLARYLAAAGHDCWILELRGHGLSDHGAAPSDFEAFATLDVPAAIRRVQAVTGAGRVFWVGHSGGALVLLMHLARAPALCARVAGLVMLGSQATEAGATLGNRLWICAGFALNNVLRRMPGRALRLGPEDEHREVMNQWFGWNWRRRWRGRDGFDYLAASATLALPTLAFAGARDRYIAPPEGCRRLVEAIGGRDKQLVVCGRGQGFALDYTHAALIASDAARREIWPLVAAWIDARSDPGGLHGA